MYKIIFYCNWGSTTKQILDKYKLFTKNNKGIYKNIKGVSNVDEADIIIFLEGIPNNFNFNLLKNKIVICFPREPFFNLKKNWESLKLKNGFTYDNFYHVVTYPQFLNKDYDFFLKLQYDSQIKTKNLSLVSSGKNYKERKKFIIKISNILKNRCHIYGSNWNKNELNNESYKGVLGCYHNNINKYNKTKYDGLINYKFSICIENIKRKNYFSEKFTDAILCWTIPIYYGCPNILDFFPKDAFYIININEENIHEKIINIINKPITNKNIIALQKARDLILNKYNIWGTINNLIHNINI